MKRVHTSMHLRGTDLYCLLQVVASAFLEVLAISGLFGTSDGRTFNASTQLLPHYDSIRLSRSYWDNSVRWSFAAIMGGETARAFTHVTALGRYRNGIYIYEDHSTKFYLRRIKYGLKSRTRAIQTIIKFLRSSISIYNGEMRTSKVSKRESILGGGMTYPFSVT